MRALTINGYKPLLALLLGSGWCVQPAFADLNEPDIAGHECELDSIPASNVPLPLATGKPEQKPTSVAYTDKQIAVTYWGIELRPCESGRDKPAQTMSVLSDWKSAPLSPKLAKSDENSKPVYAAPRDSGDQKPTLGIMPAQSSIVRVNWALKPTPKNDCQAYRNSANFHADQCPFVAMNFDEVVLPQKQLLQTHRPIQPSIEPSLSAQTSKPAHAGFAPVRRGESSPPDAQAAAELKQLLLIPENHPQDTYLTELSDLLQGESNWIFGNEGLLDLAPEEGSDTSGVSYLDELNSLLPSQDQSDSNTEYRKTSTNQSNDNDPGNRTLQIPGNRQKSYNSIEPDQPCHSLTGVGVSSLFKSISSVQLNGLSTSPPLRSRNDVAVTAELSRPENKACQFMDSYAPDYYATPVRFQAGRPIRNAHTFWHRPLYYEDPNLERCGRTHGCMTTAVSSANFVTAIAFTPYLIGANHPKNCVQSLPDCPTCHCFNCSAYWPGWSWQGAALQAAAVTGLYFAFVP